jgi:hypothetical protein
MSTTKHVTRTAVFAACCLLAACAGSAESQPSAASPAAEPAAPPGASQRDMAPSSRSSYATAPAAGAASMPADAPPPPASAPASTPPSAQATADTSRDQPAQPSTRSANKAGMSDVERAEREIASGDCATACRALGSMERAVAFLCMQSQSDGDANRCTDAKSRLVTSRKRVRTSCGSCAGGPSVDPDAPVPSTR